MQKQIGECNGFEETFLTVMLVLAIVPVALAGAGSCGATMEVDGATCFLNEAGNNGDGRTYCQYICLGGGEIIKIV